MDRYQRREQHLISVIVARAKENARLEKEIRRLEAELRSMYVPKDGVLDWRASGVLLYTMLLP